MGAFSEFTRGGGEANADDAADVSAAGEVQGLWKTPLPLPELLCPVPPWRNALLPA